MARARKKSDDVYNARRRFTRRAERLISAANNESDVNVASRLKAEATSLLEQAAAGYESQRDKQAFLNKYGITGYKVPISQTSPEKQRAYEYLSRRQLEGRLQDADIRRDRSAKNLLSSAVGRRIYAATANIWRGRDYYTRDELIMDFFGVDSMADVVRIFEDELGADLYDKPEDFEKYLLAAARGMILVQQTQYGEMDITDII